MSTAAEQDLGGSRPGEALAFLSPLEARTVETAMARIFPSDDLGPGATEAGAVFYLDRALAGAEQHNQLIYRAGVRWLDALAEARFGASFTQCTPANQDCVLADIQAGLADQIGDSPDGPTFFDLLRAHTIEGLFADPVHGGNRDLIGWKLLGFPGPQPGYSHAEQQLNAVIRRDRIYTAADYPLPEAE
jgi:hypothetical protein